MTAYEYSPAIFNVSNIAEARRIILTGEKGLSSEQRWEAEAAYLMTLLADNFRISDQTKVLDFGCGIGRLARELINKYHCVVVGVDISSSMRSLASNYCPDKRFMVCHPCMPARMGMEFDVWALQHVLDLPYHTQLIKRLLKTGGELFVVNERNRAIPTAQGAWVHDGVDTRKELCTVFEETKYDQLNENIVTAIVKERTFWGVYKKKAVDSYRQQSRSI